MNTKTNLFIVCSPLQIINAIEAVYHFKLAAKNNILVIVYSSYNNSNNKQMDLVAKYYNWQQTLAIGGIKTKSKFFSYLATIKRLKRDSYNYIFSGGYSSAYDVILANLIKNSFFVMDDGVATIDIYHKRLKANKKNKFRLKYVRFWLFGLKTQIKHNINLFTYFDLKALPNLEIVKNSLSHFSQKIANFTQHKVIYFLGHPHKDLEAYANIMQNFINNHSDNKIIYAPHRSEAISEELKSIFKQYNVEIKIFGMPVELYFLENKIYPYIVVGFNTTAFFTLKFLYPNAQYKSIYYLNNNSTDISKKIYKHIYAIGVKKN